MTNPAYIPGRGGRRPGPVVSTPEWEREIDKRAREREKARADSREGKKREKFVDFYICGGAIELVR